MQLWLGPWTILARPWPHVAPQAPRCLPGCPACASLTGASPGWPLVCELNFPWLPFRTWRLLGQCVWRIGLGRWVLATCGEQAGTSVPTPRQGFPSGEGTPRAHGFLLRRLSCCAGQPSSSLCCKGVCSRCPQTARGLRKPSGKRIYVILRGSPVDHSWPEVSSGQGTGLGSAVQASVLGSGATCARLAFRSRLGMSARPSLQAVCPACVLWGVASWALQPAYVPRPALTPLWLASPQKTPLEWKCWSLR